MANNQGSAGIRFKLVDKSGFTSNVQTYPVVGVVGHSTKGPFNQIIGIESDDVAGAVIGTSGFNVGKYNFGLLGVKAALLGGGAADFVRLYNPASGRSLKTDAWTAYYGLSSKDFTVGYHYATTLDSGDLDSTGALYMDGFTHGTRAINHITTVAASGRARTFDVDAYEASYKYYTDSMTASTVMALPIFSVMAVDPTQVRQGDGIKVGLAQSTNLIHAVKVDINVTSADWSKYIYSTIADVSNVNKKVITVGVGVNQKAFALISSAAQTGTVVPGAIPVIINASDVALATEASRIAVRDAFVSALAQNGYSPVKTAVANVYVIRYYGNLADSIHEVLSGNVAGFTIGETNPVMIDIADHAYAVSAAGAEYLVPADSVFTFDAGVTTFTFGAASDYSIDNVNKTITFDTDATVTVLKTGRPSGVIFAKSGTVMTFVGDQSKITITESTNVATVTITGTDDFRFRISKSANFSAKIPNVLKASPVLSEYTSVSLVNGPMIGGSSVSLPYLTPQQAVSFNTNPDTAAMASIAATQVVKWYPTLVVSANASGATLNVKGVYNFSGAAALTTVNSIANIIVDQSIGSTFLGLNLATRQSIKSATGANQTLYVLNANGITVADVYVKLSVTYAGVTKNYSGTIVPMAAGTRNLYIAEQFGANDGYVFVVNANDDFTDLALNGDIALSEVTGASTFTHYINDKLAAARWTYKPSEHNDSVGIQAAWRLFLDKDITEAAYLCAAGTTVQNINTKYESLDHGVIAAMLDVCSKRSTTFAFLDGLALPGVDDLIIKSEGLNGYGFDQAMWGAIYDDRDKMDDVYYTRLTQEIPSSIGVTNRVVSNSGSGMWWLPPAGVANGGVPGIFASKGQKNHRTYNYSEDTNSDIAKLTAANINAKRQTKRGTVYYNEATLVQQNSVFQRVHASMFLAGMNRRFEELFEPDVFRLNDAALRSNVEKSAQKVLDFALTSAQPGITSGRAICNSSNNTADTLANRELILDIADLAITETAEKWTIRTTAIQSGTDGTVSTSVQLIKQ